MAGTIQVLGVVFGALLIIVGIAEAFFIRDQRLHRFFLVDPEDVQTVLLRTFNLGFYNVIRGTGAVTGALMLADTDAAAGRALLLFTGVARHAGDHPVSCRGPAAGKRRFQGAAAAGHHHPAAGMTGLALDAMMDP